MSMPPLCEVECAKINKAEICRGPAQTEDMSETYRHKERTGSIPYCYDSPGVESEGLTEMETSV